jgi:parallel beta-helix repeat protein
MNKKLITTIMIMLFLASITVSVIPVSAQTKKPIHVYPGQSIQAAIDAAGLGGRVIVHAGEYHQSVVIPHSIVLISDGAILDGTPPVDTTTPPSTLTYDAIRIEEGVRDVTIKYFEIRDYKDTGSGQGNGIQAWNRGTSNIKIIGNTIHDNSWNAILVGNEGEGLHVGWEIKDNTVYNNGFYNIEITNGKDCVIAGNTVTGPGGIYAVGILVQARNFASPDDITSSGIVVADNIVSGFSGGWRSGIYLLAYAVTGKKATLTDVRVSDNEAHMNRYGIFAWGYGESEVKNIRITDNSVHDNIVDASTGGGDGIRLLGTYDSLVSDNTVLFNGRDGIRMSTGSSANQISDNTALNNGRHDLRNDDDAGVNVWKDNVYGTKYGF